MLLSCDTIALNCLQKTRRDSEAIALQLLQQLEAVKAKASKAKPAALCESLSGLQLVVFFLHIGV